jgi:ATP-dependent RNA helicase DDX56/DBP9
MTILDPSETFASLAESVGLDVRLRKAVSRLGHVRPTLVQSKCLPLALSSGRDLLVRARTGSGKTLAYSLPLLQKILQRSKSGVGAVVLVPTRELCTQVHQVLQGLSYYCNDIISIAILSAGRGRGEKAQEELTRQEAMLRDQPNVLVATPAGLLTQIRSGLLDLKSSVETLVVDEADLVLSFGYAKDIAEIVKSLPRICQGFLMSATLSPELDSLKKIVLNSPVVLKLEQDEKTSTGVGHLKQFYVALPKRDKNLVVYVFLKLGLLKGKGLFFVNSTDAGYRLKLFLEQFSIRSAVLNAELPFRSRLNIIEQFNVGNFDYLIATDASTDAEQKEDSDDEHEANVKKLKTRKADSQYGVSRGLDFRNVSFVVNVDFPLNSRSYSHRVGRTARGGAKGVALSFVELESKQQHDTLLAVQDDQPSTPLVGASGDKLQAVAKDMVDESGAATQQPQPVPLDFDLHEIEGFRYRCEDVQRAVTRMAVRETRAAELKAEILNSERLQAHFEDNPADLQLLRHDRVATHISRVQDHLKHVPKYLLPRGMQVANLNRKRKKKRTKGGTGGERRSDNDPLQSFDGDVNLDSVQGEEGEDQAVDFFEDDEDKDTKKKQKTEDKKVFTNTKDGTGRSTAGRNSWKEKHNKGQFSGKKRKSDRRYKEPLGI